MISNIPIFLLFFYVKFYYKYIISIPITLIELRFHGVIFVEFLILFIRIIIADINKIRYNVSVVLPIPGNGSPANKCQ